MPLLDIATAQLSLQNSLPPVCPQSVFHSQGLLGSWKISQFHRRLRFPLGDLNKQGTRLMIRAVATLDPKPSVKRENSTDDSSLPTHVELLELDDREKIRRMKISKANKGGTPWNKGRKHSQETRNLIRERTRIAMQDPKVRVKLFKVGTAQSEETKKKIGVGVRKGWMRRRAMFMTQEGCHFEWQNLVAEASRKGQLGEDELQWDSFQVLDEDSKRDWAESIKLRRSTRRLSEKRAPKPLEQRKRIAAAIAAKWTDPGYRERVTSGRAKSSATTDGAERKPKKNPSGIGSTQPEKKSRTRKKSSDENDSSKTPMERIRSRRRDAPLYKDPMVSSKFKMLKQIREQRTAEESKKTDAIERARLLIAEAEMAAKALEIAALNSPVARVSLMETRKLIAEAIQSMESIEGPGVTSNDNGSYLSVQSTEMGSENGGSIQPDQKEVNGSPTFSIGEEDKELDFLNFTLPRTVNGEESFPLSSSGFQVSSTLNLEDMIMLFDSSIELDQLQPNGISVNEDINGADFEVDSKPVEDFEVEEEISSKPVKVIKKWVRGRLVEVTEEISDEI